MMALMMMQKMKMMMSQQNIAIPLNTQAYPANCSLNSGEKPKNQYIVDVDHTENIVSNSTASTGTQAFINQLSATNWQSSIPPIMQAHISSMASSYQSDQQPKLPNMYMQDSYLLTTSAKHMQTSGNKPLPNTDRIDDIKSQDKNMLIANIDIIDVDSPNKQSSRSHSRPTSTGKSTLATTADKNLPN